MLISYGKKFIYIQVWKTGSTSLMAALKPYSYQFDRYERFARAMSRRLGIEDAEKWKVHFNTHKHSTADEISKLVKPELFNGYFKFCFVRNPFDWLVSQYSHIISQPNHRHYELARYLGSFDKYVRWRVESGNRVLQMGWSCSSEGDNLVDFVGRFETLDNDLKFIAEKLSVKIEMPHLNRSTNRGDYREYYKSQQLVDFVLEHYREDFTHFGYKMSI
jgi:Sulfotransferase family